MIRTVALEPTLRNVAILSLLVTGRIPSSQVSPAGPRPDCYLRRPKPAIFRGVSNFEQTDDVSLHISCGNGLTYGCWLPLPWDCQIVGCAMTCLSCRSGQQAELSAEMLIHFPGFKNIDKPGVLVFPKLQVCMDCGFSRFTVPATELASVAKGLRDKSL
jgi:hypothetical protein